MSTSSRTFTEEDLLRMPSDGKRYELVRGELKEMSPTGYEHGRCTGNFHVLLGEHVRERKLGSVLAAETGFILERTEDGRPTVRAADVAFVAAGRVPKGADTARYLEMPPDVVVETLSPHDSAVEVDAKTADWMRAGVRVLLVLNPSSRSVTVHRPSETIRLGDTDELDLSAEVPGFRCRISDIFD